MKIDLKNVVVLVIVVYLVLMFFGRREAYEGGGSAGYIPTLRNRPYMAEHIKRDPLHWYLHYDDGFYRPEQDDTGRWRPYAYSYWW